MHGNDEEGAYTGCLPSSQSQRAEVIGEQEGVKLLGPKRDGEGWEQLLWEGNWESATAAKYQTARLGAEVQRALQWFVYVLCSVW